MRFEGTDRYVAPRELQLAVNAAITLERPLHLEAGVYNLAGERVQRTGSGATERPAR